MAIIMMRSRLVVATIHFSLPSASFFDNFKSVLCVPCRLSSSLEVFPFSSYQQFCLPTFSVSICYTIMSVRIVLFSCSELFPLANTVVLF